MTGLDVGLPDSCQRVIKIWVELQRLFEGDDGLVILLDGRITISQSQMRFDKKRRGVQSVIEFFYCLSLIAQLRIAKAKNIMRRAQFRLQTNGCL